MEEEPPPPRQRRPRARRAITPTAAQLADAPEFAPVPRQHQRFDGWTYERQRAFVQALAETGTVRRAAAAVGMTAESAYQLRRQPGVEGFARAWAQALAIGVESLADIAMERARHGVAVPVFYHGEPPPHRRTRAEAEAEWDEREARERFLRDTDIPAADDPRTAERDHRCHWEAIVDAGKMGKGRIEGGANLLHHRSLRAQGRAKPRPEVEKGLAPPHDGLAPPQRAGRGGTADSRARPAAMRGFRPKRSSLIERVRFDEETDTLSIWFKPSGKYTYSGVPRAIYDALKTATSAGAYFNAAIKGAVRGEGGAEKIWVSRSLPIDSRSFSKSSASVGNSPRNTTGCTSLKPVGADGGGRYAREMRNVLTAYARRIRELRRANPAISEPALAPAFQRLIEEALPLLPLAPRLSVQPEFRNPGVGRPDIALVRQGQPARAFIELKAPAKPADPRLWRDAHDKRQFARFSELAHWAVSNFAEFRLFHRDDELGRASLVPERALDPHCGDAQADRLVAEHDVAPFVRLLELLCAADAPAARDAQHLAELMAHSARLVRGIVQERLGELHAAGEAANPLLQVRQEFRDVLYAHPEAGGYPTQDFDALFSAAFAQTLAFGLLLVREGSGQPVDASAWEHMPEEHPLMRTALRVLSLPEVVRDMGVGFEVMRDTVNSFAPEILALRADGRDPILYFYEDFLQTFDPAARERYGVYYTPIEVVRYMTGALDRALRDDLGTAGLRDPAVTILDPATGTGTFLLGVAERVREQVEAEAGGVEATMALRDLASRMYGFELLVGPYAVAHYRLHHALRRLPDDAEDDAVPVALPRLGVYLSDTLAQPGAAAPAGPLGFVSAGIQDERHAADAIKAREQILAIIGNPPYRRLEEGENETLVGRWMDGVWDDLKAPVRAAGQGNQLNTFPELSVAFWRWAIWKLFEAENAPNRGVIAFITNRKFLTGWPYAGLRQMMRERFDRIEIVDLRGDVRTGARANVEGDHGVFNIMVGTCITLAIADGSKIADALAEVTYVDTWTQGYFARRAKLDWLLVGAETGAIPNGIVVEREGLDDLRPRPFLDGDLIGLEQCFMFRRSGLQTKRDLLVYAPHRAGLVFKIQAFLDAGPDQARHLFHDTRDRKWVAAQAAGLERQAIARASYRPLDQRYLYNSRAHGDFLRPELQEVWGESNVGLYAMPSGTGAGPATWCHGLLPDYHSFSGRGGYAFPLYDRRAGAEATNLSPVLLEHLSAAYGAIVTAPDAFDAILCLLSASSYTRRFAEDLEDVFPHVPFFPADHAVFTRAVAVGREIRAVETFSRDPAAQGRGFCRLASEPSGVVGPIAYADGAIALCADGTGRITGIPQAVWDFAVSGYRLLFRWIDGRAGLPADLALVREFRDVAARIAELIHRFEEADLVLADTLADTITRDDLGFANAPDPVAGQMAEGAADERND